MNKATMRKVHILVIANDDESTNTYEFQDDDVDDVDDEESAT